MADMSDQDRVSQTIRVGDMVALTRSFIDRHSRPNGSIALANGKVAALHRIAEGIVLADIEWKTPGLSKRLDVKSLVRIAG
jgi:hypothetical protein